MEITPDGLWSLLDKGGVLAFGTLLLWALVSGRLAPKYVVDDLKKERDEAREQAKTFRSLAFRGTDLAGDSNQLNAQAIQAAEIAIEVFTRQQRARLRPAGRAGSVGSAAGLRLREMDEHGRENETDTGNDAG